MVPASHTAPALAMLVDWRWIEPVRLHGTDGFGFILPLMLLDDGLIQRVLFLIVLPNQLGIGFVPDLLLQRIDLIWISVSVNHAFCAPFQRSA